jgi:membrane protease YdiL (CAAX protease family)
MSEPELDYAVADSKRRLEPGEGVAPVWILTLIGMGAFIVVSAVYGTIKLANAPKDVPATQIAYTPFETVVLNAVVPAGVIVALLAGSAVIRPYRLKTLGLSASKLTRSLAIGLVAAVVVVPIVHLSGGLTEFFWKLVGLEHPTAHPLLRAGDELADPMLRALIVISAIILAPAAEELLFRGHLQTAMVYSFDPRGGWRAQWASIVLTSGVFTIFHGELWMMPPIFLLSLLLGILYERTANLWVPIIVHALFNASSVVYFFWLARQH